MTAAIKLEQSARPERRPFGPDTRLWEDIGLITFSLTAGSAFLLQTMEPTIAAVVDEHSTFRTDPMGRAMRSLASVMMWVYGGDEALAEADRLRKMHASLNTTDAHGRKHQALSSGPWAWVLHTGVFAFTEGNKYFSADKLTDADKEAYYQETVQLMRNFSVAPKEIPATYAEWEPWFWQQVENHLEVTTVAYDYLKVIRKIAPPKQIPRPLHPLWRAATTPVGRLQYFFTVGTTPNIVRDKLGLEWTANDERTLRVLGWLIGRTIPMLPERIRYFPIAYEARKLERDRARLRKMINLRPM
ncbi:oxygenase MpaB family protein [Nocardia sp. CDC160]|uniref:oxygenase MpaB family protein n=1 Tax=Nocardia sp. CDC160 TaxID=3112166 RepID=UPI002DBAEF06|nr:oxygenase MpaB family protein [Nocardia sp. CDC160]MEC3915868.1 oxygenase MpaB family protein [Nocardia sp. CDC160]